MLPVAYPIRTPIELPSGHRFPHDKMELLQLQLLHRGILQPEQLYQPALLDKQMLALAHTEAYLERIFKLELNPTEVRRIGLPLTRMLVHRAHASASASFQAALVALQLGLGIHLGGGTHHAYADKAEGYCLFNDVAISARYLLTNGHIRRALVVDLDVHQGNGTAAIFQQESAVFTFSMHCRDNYPLRKEVSDLDVELPAFTEDDAYLAALCQALPLALNAHQPDVVYYIAGSDVLATDRLGRLRLSPSGMLARDRFVFEQVSAKNIPLVLLLGGGYSPRVADVVDAHTATIALACEFYD